jgi:FAD/FMN-containing dehydrogenase
MIEPTATREAAVADVKVRTLDGDEATLADGLVDALAGQLDGELLRPADAAYEEARRVWNGMIDRRPALIARCASVADVVAAVTFARETGTLVAVRGGGHNVAGNAVCDGGVVIDLGLVNGVSVDLDRRTARVGGGARLADVDRATQEHGLATPLGVASVTGVAGLTLSGGLGWLRRLHGLTCDNLVSAEVVTADGRVLTASDDEHPELLWALRGGGGSFGVVTSFELALHPVGPEVSLVFVLYPGGRAREVLEFFDGFMAEAPDEISPICILGRVPPGEPFPEEAWGRPFAAYAAVHPGAPEEGERVLRPLRELGDPIADLSGTMPWVDVQALLDADYPDGHRYYWKSLEFESLTPELIERAIAHAAAAPSGHSTLDVWYHGGAMSRVDAAATAFGERALILFGYEANFEHAAGDEANVSWVRECIDELRPLSTGGAYLNFPGFFEEGEELLRTSYGEENYARLRRVKAQYDPTNLFRLNGGIRPA